MVTTQSPKSAKLNIPEKVTRRERPYTWATWLRDHIASGDPCDAKLAAPSHYLGLPRGSPVPPTWHIEHGELVRQIKDDAVASGGIVTVEEQNSFKWTSPLGITVAGKPDVVTRYGEEHVISDAKIGSPALRDQVQVLLYMHFVGLTKKTQSLPEGQLVYKNDGIQAVPSSWLDNVVLRRIDEALMAVASESLAINPTIENCKWCALRAICPGAI